uniref:Cytoplasmic tRNA 2-thiolation protein 1 (Trinotate prediction) n=1 Tax=Myxobolus squamalis TaxID=59785 RepID=A0A6B2FXS5_MYXSQ
MVGAIKLVTGHNADDTAETVIMNILRGDINRLPKCTRAISTDNMSMPRCKPLIYSYEKEIVLYAKYQKLEYFATECVYSPYGYRGSVRTFIKDLESVKPISLLNIIKAAESFETISTVKAQHLNSCQNCGFDTSQTICQACVLIETLQNKLEKQTRAYLP